MANRFGHMLDPFWFSQNVITKPPDRPLNEVTVQRTVFVSNGRRLSELPVAGLGGIDWSSCQVLERFYNCYKECWKTENDQFQLQKKKNQNDAFMCKMN